MLRLVFDVHGTSMVCIWCDVLFDVLCVVLLFVFAWDWSTKSQRGSGVIWVVFLKHLQNGDCMRVFTGNEESVNSIFVYNSYGDSSESEDVSGMLKRGIQLTRTGAPSSLSCYIHIPHTQIHTSY